MWNDNDVRRYGEGTKYSRHPVVGPIAMDYSAFAVDGRPILPWWSTLLPRRLTRTGLAC